MRFIGNKENLVEKIYSVMQSKGIKGDSFFDFFAGTTNVGRFFKKIGYQIYCSDLLYFSYVLQRASITNNNEPQFNNLLPKINHQSRYLLATPLQTVVDYLDRIDPVEGFIYNNYTPSGTADLEQPRMFFSDENGKKIDAIRIQIENWKTEELINEDEYFILLACLIETCPFYANITGVFAAFQKNWDPRAVKKLTMRTIEIVTNKRTNYSYNQNSADLIDKIKSDIYYLDPPYNQRQYAPNYHLLETIAKYDNPEIKGVAGLRDYQNEKSRFCNSKTALEELERIASIAECKHLLLSYNSEGIMPSAKIVTILQKYGNVELVEFEYLRFKSNNNGESKTKKHISEQLYVLTKK